MGAWQSKAPPATLLCWSNLPPELADLVLRRLPSLADRVRFAAVCRHWLRVATRYSAPTLPPSLPWLLHFHDGTLQSLPDGELHSYRSRKHAVCVGSSGRWLLFQEPAARPRRRHFLMNPLRRGRNLLRLPGHCEEPVKLNSDGSYSAPSGSRSTRFYMDKVIVCSSDLVVANVYYQPSSSNVVACCRPGVSRSWSAGVCNGASYQDMAFYKGKVYAVTDEEGHLFAHEIDADDEEGDAGEPRIARVEQVIQAAPTLDGSYATDDQYAVRMSYLVISCAGRLLMVRWIVPLDLYTSKDSTRQMTLKVFEADFEESRWLQVESLEDQVLFVSSNSSRAMATQGRSDCLQGNKIYFVDDQNLSRYLWPINRSRKCGVYDMSSNTIQSISLGEAHIISDQMQASWFFPHG